MFTTTVFKHIHETPVNFLFITNPRLPSRPRNISDEKETNDSNHTTITFS